MLGVSIINQFNSVALFETMCNGIHEKIGFTRCPITILDLIRIKKCAQVSKVFCHWFLVAPCPKSGATYIFSKASVCLDFDSQDSVHQI